MKSQFASAILLSATLAAGNDTRAERPLKPLAEKESLHLVVTDSGLGGLSIAADLARRAAETNGYQQLDITFANALFREGGGYNSLGSREEKIAVFNNALEAMDQRYQPDAILVACNTLSVLLPHCPATSGETPVVGIVEPGVEMIRAELKENPAATALIFATQTTVEEGSHRQALLDRGIGEDRFVIQACPNLTWYIEREPEGFETELLISNFLSQALEKRAGQEGPVALSFNCTHFGYSQALWVRALEDEGIERTATLNPNSAMSAPLFPDTINGRFQQTTVNVRVESMVEISQTSVDALAPILEEASPKTAEALRRWEKAPALFQWEDIVKGKAPGEAGGESAM